jgi:hypothetical protein
MAISAPAADSKISIGILMLLEQVKDRFELTFCDSFGNGKTDSSATSGDEDELSCKVDRERHVTVVWWMVSRCSDKRSVAAEEVKIGLTIRRRKAGGHSQLLLLSSPPNIKSLFPRCISGQRSTGHQGNDSGQAALLPPRYHVTMTFTYVLRHRPSHLFELLPAAWDEWNQMCCSRVHLVIDHRLIGAKPAHP